MHTEIIRSRIDPAIKDQANQVLHNMGLTMSDAVRLFLRQVIAEQRLPFEVKVVNELTLKALQAADKGEVERKTLDDLTNEWHQT